MPRPPTAQEEQALEWAVETLGSLPKRKPITVAIVMKTLGQDTRTSIRLLKILERLDLLTRSGGGRGEAFIWTRNPK